MPDRCCESSTAPKHRPWNSVLSPSHPHLPVSTGASPPILDPHRINTLLCLPLRSFESVTTASVLSRLMQPAMAAPDGLVSNLRGRLSGRSPQYSAIPSQEADGDESLQSSQQRRRSRGPWGERRRCPLVLVVAFALIFALLIFTVAFRRSSPTRGPCEQEGLCEASPQIWGQYSPFFSVPSDIDASVPSGCELTFALVLSRHGARDPTARKSVLYASLIDRIHAAVSKYGAGYEWLRSYKYALGEDQLTAFGVKQMVDSGAAFYTRYHDLVGDSEPFVRAAGSQRVIESSEHFVRGFYTAQDREGESEVKEILVIPEQAMENNTLNNRLCSAYGSNAGMVAATKETWNKIWIPDVQQRLNEKLPGANLSTDETIFLMDLCPFESVAHEDVRISKFCELFSEDEWLGYDYFQSIGKWYGYGPGNPFGATLGVGFVNELISRLTGKPVQDETSTNSTLDRSPETFPLDRKLYADFSHDNDMTSIYGAMGLYNSTGPLPVTHRTAPREADGYSAAWTVPFAGRMYVEKMRCPAADTGRRDDEEAAEEELVRVLMNDRVVPVPNCEVDALGRCRLGDFVRSLEFARGGGRWDECFL